MISELEYIRLLDNRNELNIALIEEYAKKRGFVGIYLIDANGKLELSLGEEKPPFLPLDNLKRLVSGKNDDITFGMLKGNGVDDKRLAVGIHRENGGAIIGCRQGRNILSVRRVLDLELLLKNITSDSTIKYIAIQDTNSILYSTLNDSSSMGDSLSMIYDDEFLHDAFKNQSFSWRISDFQGEKIIETVHYNFESTLKSTIIRIALEYNPIQKIQRETLSQATLRLSVLIFLGFLMIAYSIMLQNNQILEIEKIKITEEVTSLQANLVHKEKLSAIGELAAGVAHKIRNPLNAISMTIQRYDSEFEVKEDSEEFHKLNNIIKKEINQISDIINQFLQFSRPTGICKTKTNVNDLIHKVIALYVVTLRKRNIELKFREESYITAYLDDDKIKQSIMNLIENAIDATDDGGKIDIHLKAKSKKIFIAISDSGSGISEEALSKIFNLYFTTKEKGTGIGLAQVYRVISEHDGKILVDSHIDVGTTFTLIIPLRKTSDESTFNFTN